MQHHVRTQVAALVVLDVVLRLVVDALRERRAVEDRLQQHLAPVALHLRVAFQCVGQVPGVGRDVLVQLHEAFELVFQLAALFVLVGVDALDPFAELGDVLAEGFQQEVQRLLVRLLELPRLLAEDLRGEVFEFQAEALLQLLACGTFGVALLGVLRPQGVDLRGRRGPQGGQLGLCAEVLFAQRPQFGLRSVTGLTGLREEGFGGGKALAQVGQRGFGSRFFAPQAGRLAAQDDGGRGKSRNGCAEQDDDQNGGRIHILQR